MLPRIYTLSLLLSVQLLNLFNTCFLFEALPKTYATHQIKTNNALRVFNG